MTRLFCAIAVCFALLPVASPSHADDPDPTITFSKSDEEMNRAIREARSRLDWFLDGIESGRLPADGAALKVAVPKGDGGAEHIWMFDFERTGDRFVGTVGNRPVHVADMQLGDRYSFSRGQISDWIYLRGEMMHGAYTLHVMLTRMPARDAEQLRRSLAPWGEE